MQIISKLYESVCSVCRNKKFCYSEKYWAQDAPIRSVLNVQMSGFEAVEWSDIDVDLWIDRPRHQEHCPRVLSQGSIGRQSSCEALNEHQFLWFLY